MLGQASHWLGWEELPSDGQTWAKFWSAPQVLELAGRTRPLTRRIPVKINYYSSLN